jgi:ABC-2 type transport system permease protein
VTAQTAAGAVTPRVFVRVGRRPTRVVLTLVGRAAARSGALWGLVFALYTVAQTSAYVSAYPTQASRDQLATALGTNVGLNALIGPARALNTVAGYASWRALGVLSLLGGVWGLLTATRLLRGEEEAGRQELLLAGPTTRARAAAQAVAGLGVGLLALWAVTAAGAVLGGRAKSVGFGTGQSLYFSLTLVAGAAVFLAVGALTSQLAGTRRRAATMAGAVFGVAYALRMVADSDPTLHWMVWLSPLGWIEEARPLTDPQPLALLPVLALVVLASGAAVRLAAARDLNAAVLPDHDTARPRLALLGGPTGLALRLMRPTALVWLAAVTAFSLLIGTVAEAAARGISGNTAVENALARLGGGHGSLVAAYLGFTFLVFALLVAMVAAGQLTALRAEEADGRLDHLLVRPVRRGLWYAGRLALTVLLVVAVALLAGLGAWAGAASQHSGVGLGPLLEAGANLAPPALLIAGLGALAFGARPRLTGPVVYGYLTWSFLVEFVGAVVHANHWILDSSVFFHMAPAPAVAPHWGSSAVMAGLGLGAMLLGGVLFHRRDVTGA